MNNFICLILILGFLIILLYLLNNNKLIERYSESSAFTQSEGASEYYNWGYKPIVNKEHHKHIKDKECKKYYYNYYQEKEDVCKKCNILDNKDIDKYVLKSSIPSCPNMSNYAKKSMIQAVPDISKYILKSNIEPCPGCPDLRNYIKKSKIRPCSRRRHPVVKNITLNEYNIEDHKDIVKYIKKDKINTNYITSLPDYNNLISKERCNTRVREASLLNRPYY